MKVAKKDVICVFPGAKEKSVLGRLYDLYYDRGEAVIDLLPYQIEKSQSKTLPGNKVLVKTTYLVGEKQEIRLPIDNTDEKPDTLQLFCHPITRQLTFNPEELQHLGDFPRYNELKEQFLAMQATMHKYTQSYKGMLEMYEKTKNQVIDLETELAYQKFIVQQAQDLIKGVEVETINLRQQNSSLSATLEAVLSSTTGDRSIFKYVTDLLDKSGELVGSLTGRIADYRKSLAETPDMDDFLRATEDVKKKQDKLEAEYEKQHEEFKQILASLKIKKKVKLPPPQEVLDMAEDDTNETTQSEDMGE